MAAGVSLGLTRNDKERSAENDLYWFANILSLLNSKLLIKGYLHFLPKTILDSPFLHLQEHQESA